MPRSQEIKCLSQKSSQESTNMWENKTQQNTKQPPTPTPHPSQRNGSFIRDFANISFFFFLVEWIAGVKVLKTGITVWSTVDKRLEWSVEAQLERNLWWKLKSVTLSGGAESVRWPSSPAFQLSRCVFPALDVLCPRSLGRLHGSGVTVGAPERALLCSEIETFVVLLGATFA